MPDYGETQSGPVLKPVDQEVFEGKEFYVTKNGIPEKQKLERASCVIGTIEDIQIIESPNGPILKNDVLIKGKVGMPNILIIDHHHKAPIYKSILIQAGCLTLKVDEDFEDAHLDGGRIKMQGRFDVNPDGPDLSDWEKAKEEIEYLRAGSVHRPALANGQLSSLFLIRGEEEEFIRGGQRGSIEELTADFPEAGVVEKVREVSPGVYERRSENAHVFNFDMDKIHQEHNVPRDGVLSDDQIKASSETRKIAGFKGGNYDLVIIALSPGWTNSLLIVDQVKLFLTEMGLI